MPELDHGPRVRVRLDLQKLGWVLIFDYLRSIRNNWLVVREQVYLLVILSVEQINLFFQTRYYGRVQMLELIEILDLLVGLGSQKLIDGAEWHPDVESQLLQRD